MEKYINNILPHGGRGFTLIELMAVVLIIGVLSSIALPQYRRVVERSKFTKAQVMAKSMYDSCQRLVAEWGVESYSELPSSVRKISRLDIGDAADLPVGFSVSGNSISGAGFLYTLGNDCDVNVKKTSGNYAGVTMDYNGLAFYNCSDSDSGACEIYGLD